MRSYVETPGKARGARHAGFADGAPDAVGRGGVAASVRDAEWECCSGKLSARSLCKRGCGRERRMSVKRWFGLMLVLLALASGMSARAESAGEGLEARADEVLSLIHI